ncbi:Ankyrin repeat, putative [Leishmania donovani]|uniref:Ankyrin repeat, putative n=1 Tax=Leishmania donovani TaxID=5661 RepID=A0A3S5H5B5_LEIDO|nr:Ankyrin repeat, putative [Leishmania donovani]
MTKLAQVCLVALAGYVLTGLVGTYFLVRFRRLHCVRQVQPWYCIVHYVCYGGFLAYLMSAGSMRRCRGSQDIGKRTASLWGASSQLLPQWTMTSAGALPPQLDRAQSASQSSSASRVWQVCVLLGQVVLDAFLSPWTEVVPASPSPAAATRIVRLYDIYEPLLQAIAATAFFSSFALLCNARWRYAVMGTAERHPGLWSAIVGVNTTTATAAALARATEEANKDGASILDGTSTYAAVVASLSPPMRRGSVVAPRILVQRSLAAQRRHSARAPSYVNRARDRGDSTQGNLADSGVSTRISISTPGAEDVCGGGDLPATVRANQVKRATGGLEAAAAAAASMDDVLVEDATLRGSRRKSWRRSVRPTRPQQQQKRAPSPINDDYDDIDDDDEKMWNSVEPGSSASHVTSSSLFRDNEDPSSTSSSLWRRLMRCSGRRLWPFSACVCEEGQDRTSRNGSSGDGCRGRSSRERHRHLQHLRQRLLAAFWLSDAVVVLLTFLMFALLAVARVAAATATASAWAAVEASKTQGSSGLERGRRGGQRLLTATAAVPCPTEGFVGVAGLLLLAAERVLVGRWMRLPGQLLASVSAAAAAASVETPAARQQQLRPRLPCRSWRRLGSSTFRSSLDLWHLPSTGRLHGVETAGSAAMSATATAAVASMTPVPFHFRHVLTVALLLLMLQFFSDAAWAWAAAVLLTTGSAVANLVDAVADSLRWVSTEYRRLLCRTWWELFFSFSFTPASLESVNAQEQHVAGSMPAATPGSIGGLGLPAAVGRELLVSRGNSIGMAVSATVMPPFGSRLRRHSIAHRSARLMKAGGGTGPLWMVRRLGASFAGTAVDSASSLSPPSAVTAMAATVLEEGATSVVVGKDREDDGLLSGDAPGSHGVAGGGAAVVTAISPMQFWHSVAAKVLQQSGKATGEAAEPGSSSSHALGGAEDVNGVGVVPTVAAALLHPMPTVNPLAMLSPTPGMEHLSSASARFTRENLKGSMLLKLPTVARVGGKAEAAELDMRERLLAMERAELRHEERAMRAQQLSASDTMAAASTLSDENEEKLHAGNPPAHSVVPGAREHAGHHDDDGGALENAREAQQQQSVTQDGWLSRALATVMPGFAATRCCSCEGDGVPISSLSTQLDSTSTVLNVSFNENLSLSSSATRAWINEEEGFARFLDCVRRDGDNTYALQSLLAVYGHTYRHRVDAKGRGALHYAAMGGFVQGAIFLSRIGAEPNILDKAGYAPLHYAVLYRTEVHTSPRITTESPSTAVQGARHVVGIPIVETTAVQAAAQATRRRRRDQQQRLKWVQAQLQAAYSAGSDASSGVEGRNSSGRSPQETTLTKTGRETSLRTRSDPVTTSIPGKPLAVSPLQIFTPSSQRPLSSMGVGNAAAGSTSSAVRGPNPAAIPATATAIPAAAAAAAAVVEPEEGHWYGMVGALVRLGAQVDLPTAKGLTALHLAVMQGSVGLVNTLLREGANPLLGPELETRSLASIINAASCWESDKENTEVLMKGAGKTAAPCSSGGQANDQVATHPTQQQQTLSDTPQCTSNKGRDTTSLVSSENDNSRTALGDASGSLALFTQHCEWVDMHITNAGNPIVNGHCKSPLLLAVELDADLAVASMLHCVALQATTARVVAGLSQSMVAAPRMFERPPSALLAAPQGAASQAQGCPPLASLPVAAASGDLPTSPAPRSRAFAASAAHPLADNGAGDAAMALPSPMSAAAAALSTSCSSTNVCRPGSRRMSPHTPGIADTSFSSSTTTTITAAAAIPDSPSTRTWWERCCLHGFNPVHIALVLGNAQVARVLLLRWCYTEDVAHNRDAAAAPHKCVRDAEKLGGRARELSSNEPRTTISTTPALPESALATTTTTVPPLLSSQATAGPDVTDSTLLDFASGANISFHVDGLAAEQQQQQPVLAHVAAPLSEEADGCSQYTSVSGEAAAAAAPTAAISLGSSTGPAAFWVRSLRLNLFHLAAVGDSTECLAYVLRWRGAPDYVPCALDEVFENEQRAESVRRESATATQDAYQRRRQRRRLRAYQSSQAACDLAGVAESLAMVAATTEPSAPNMEEYVFPADAGSSSAGAPGVGHMMASGGGAAAAEAAPLLEKMVELDDFSRSPSSLPAAATTSEVVVGIEEALQRSLGPSSTDPSRTCTTEMSFKSDTDVIASSSTSDIFNHTWSSATLSAESNEAASTAGAPTTPPRERRTRAKQQGFVRALVTLLQTNIRVDAVRRRVRKTVFGSSTFRKTTSPRRVNSRRQSSQRPRMGRGDDEDGDGSNDNTVMAKTCFGSISAAAALHTGMAVCYASMDHPPRRRKRGEYGSEKDADGSSSRSRSSSSSSNHENVKCHIVEAPGAPRELYRQAKGAERPRRLRQQRTRAFVSAVAKLRHCIAGVPIDITHLAAVETAVDRACAQMASSSARRALQQALLIVARRLQNQHRRAQLVTGLSCVAAAATAAMEAAAAQDDGQASRAESDDEPTTIPTTLAAVEASTGDVGGNRDSVSAGTSESLISSLSRSRQRDRATEAAHHHHRHRCSSPSCPSPDSASALSYYSSLHSIITTTTTTVRGSSPAAPDERASVSASDEEKPRGRRQHRQQSTLRLLRTLSAELNALDTRGLTPLHYAIANQNASMVYLLCAYGATFVFASEQTEAHLMGRSAEVIAAAAAVEHHTDGCDMMTVAASDTQPAASQDELQSTTAPTNFMSQAWSLPTAWAYARAQLSSPSINVSTDTLSSFGKRYYAQLTPPMQEALRRAAKTGSAEYLLWMPTQEDREAERQQRKLLSPLPVSEARDAVPTNPQRSVSLLAPHAVLSPAAPTTTVMSATVAKRSSPANAQLHSASPVMVPASCLTVASQRPATMAATLTAALGISDADVATRAAATAPDAFLSTEEPLAKASMMTGSVKDGSGGGDALGAQLQTHLIHQDIKTLQSMIAGKASSKVNGGSGEDLAACSHPPPQRLRASPNADVSLDEAKDEATVAANLMAGRSFKQDVARETPRQPNASSSSAPKTSAAMRTPAAATSVGAEGTGSTGITELTRGARGAAVPPSSPSSNAAAAAVEYTLLEPHDVFITHVVRNPAKAESIMRAAMEGTALRYLFLASVVSGDSL